MKAEAFRRANGKCECCGIKLSTGNIVYDHIIPDQLGGPPTLENCQVICRKVCDKEKYPDDRARIDKAKRQERAHIGARNRKGRPMPGTKASGWKQKIGGGWERR